MCYNTTIVLLFRKHVLKETVYRVLTVIIVCFAELFLKSVKVSKGTVNIVGQCQRMEKRHFVKET